MIKTFSKSLLPLRNIIIAVLLLSTFSFNRAENFESALNGYKADELKYFSEVAFMNGKLRRWGEPIRISQDAAYSIRDTEFMNELVTEIQPLLSTISVSHVPGGGNLVIHHSKTLKEYSKNYTGRESLPLGYAIPKFSSDNALIHADIYLHPSLLNDKKDEVLTHEICHMLGLLDHPSTPFTDDNLMSAAVYKNQSSVAIPRLDKAALRLLYDKRMPKSLLKVDFLKKLSLLAAR